MLGASNIRQILRDTLAILVWHADFSSLWNTFKALVDVPAWIAGFFSQVMQPQVAISISLTCVLLVCLVNMLHLSEECWLLTGQVQHHLLSSVWHFPLLLASLALPSVALATVNAVSVKEWMCEGKRARVDGWVCTCARRLLGCCLDRCSVMETETLFLFIRAPAVTVVSGVWSLNSGLWDSWRSVKSTDPPNHAECYSPEHTLDSCYWKQKLRQTT